MLIMKALSRDHRALEALFDEVASTQKSEKTRRLALFAQLQTLLQAHARAEEEVVYRRLRARYTHEARVLTAYEEHHVADVLLQELASTSVATDVWTAKVLVLAELLRNHIKEEEILLYPLLDEGFETPALAAMHKEFAALKNETAEALLGPLRRAMPAFAGRAMITLQAQIGRLARRGQLLALHQIWRSQRVSDERPPQPLLQRKRA